MKTRLLLILALLSHTLSFAQTTGQAWESIRWDKGDSVVYGRVKRYYQLYPGTTQGNTSFYTAINQGTLAIEKRVGPAWLSSRVTYLESAQSLQIDAATTANVQLKIERGDGQTMVLGNVNNPALSSGTFYGYGANPNQGAYDKQWTFGKAANGTGGVPAVPVRLTFKNVDTGDQFIQLFTPINRASRATLFVAAGSSPPAVTPSWVSARYTYAASTSYLTIEASGDPMQVMFERTDGIALTGGNTDGFNTLVSGTFYSNGNLSNQGSYDKQWQFGKRTDGSGGIPTVPIRVTFKRNSDNATFAFVFTPATVTRQSLFTSGGDTGGTTACNFTVSTANQNATCGGTITLSASVSGPDASGITYTWTGNGLNQIGQNVTVSAPQGNGSYAYTVTASKNGCTNKTATATVTVSGCGGSPLAYNRVLFIGNSILYHPASIVDLGWPNNNGMAASAPDKDFFYLTRSYLQSLNPNVDCRKWGYFYGTSEAEGGYWEGNYWRLDGGLSRYDAIADWKPDLIILRLSENIGDPSHDLLGNLGQLIDKIKSQSPSCRVVVTNSVWGQVEVSNIMQQFANSRSYPFVNLFDMWTADPGNAGLPAVTNPYYARSTGQYSNADVAKHPSDAGMALIANRIIAKIPVSAPVVVTPPTSAYFANGFGEGTVDQLMQSAPFIPSVNQYSSLASGNVTMYLDNGNVRFGIGKALGGAIKHLGLSNGGKNWINTNFEQGASDFEGELSPDTGRSGGWSMYGTPGHDYREGGGSTTEFYDTGYNPVHGGSVYGDRSRITWFERRTVQGYGEVMYCRAVIKVWALHNTDSKSTFHCYWWLEGNAVRYYSIIDNQRDDTQMSYTGSQQEGPFIYTTADLWHHYLYEGTSPGTQTGFNGLTTVSKPINNTGFYDIHNSSEGWIASLDDNNNGVILLPQHNTRFMGGQFVGYSGDQNTNNSSYINSAQMMNYDVRQSTAFGGYIYAGNINNFRSWYNSANIQRPAFSWSFGQNNTCGWWSDNAPARFINNRYSLKIGQRKNDPGDPSGGTIFRANGSLSSPFGAWKASDINTIYIKANWPAGQTAYRLSWKRSGLDNNAESSKTFSVNGGGGEQTIAIQVQGDGNWNGIIASIKIGLSDSSQGTSGNEEFAPIYIGKNQP